MGIEEFQQLFGLGRAADEVRRWGRKRGLACGTGPMPVEMMLYWSPANCSTRPAPWARACCSARWARIFSPAIRLVLPGVLIAADLRNARSARRFGLLLHITRGPGGCATSASADLCRP